MAADAVPTPGGSSPQQGSTSNAPLLEVRGLRKVFSGGGHELVAVDDVSFALQAGGSIGIVGESGSGKTTIARMIVGLETASAGEIMLDGFDSTAPPRSRADRRVRARVVQLVFQDPYSSLDPTQTIGGCLEEVLRAHFDLASGDRSRRVTELAELVGLARTQVDALPRNLSGGQRQRAAIARALAAEPRLIILDEAVASLDVSIQAQILNLLADVRAVTGTSYVLISHDLAVVRQLCETTVVLHVGAVVERGSTASVLDDPQDEYTQLLRSSVPGPGWQA